jgi:hypothetical protein
MKKQIIVHLDSETDADRIKFFEKMEKKHADKNGRGATVGAIRELIDIARTQGKE